MCPKQRFRFKLHLEAANYFGRYSKQVRGQFGGSMFAILVTMLGQKAVKVCGNGQTWTFLLKMFFLYSAFSQMEKDMS